MRCVFHPDRLVMTATRRERRHLTALRRTHPDRFGTLDCLVAALEEMTGDDEFVWLPEGTTGDLTAAPMLGVLGEEEDAPAGWTRETGGAGLYPVWVGPTGGRVCPVLARWAFLDDAVTSPLDALADEGEATWPGGELHRRPGQAFRGDERTYRLVNPFA